jgi:hypothetical protein
MYIEEFIFEEVQISLVSVQDQYTVVGDENTFVLNLLNKDELPKSAIVRINLDSVVSLQNDKLVFTIYNGIYNLEVQSAIFELDDEAVLTIRYSKNAKLIINKYVENIKSLAFETDATFIDETTYMPEFSISCFDDSNFVYTRQIRQGVPIISTVPSFVDTNSSTADIQSYNNGKGTVSKTIYFRVICNKVMETISIGESSLMELKIYIPNGLDTVKPAIYRPMTLVSNDSTNNISIYSANYDFYEQGNFDGIDYVDGYMYCDVQVPLTVQKSIPIEFDFSV